jgi:hypothetical protein
VSPVSPASTGEQIHFRDIKKNTTISFKKDGEWLSADVISRAGKVVSNNGKEGRYKHYWNLRNPQTGHISNHDAKMFTDISMVPQPDDETYAVDIPRYRHGERRCREAKQTELARFDEFDAYEEVGD